MNVSVQSYREGDHASLVLTGPFDLAHATAVEWEVENAQASLGGCASVDIDLTQLDRIDGAGAVLLARLLDRLDADGRHASVVEGSNRKAARLIGLYRERKSNRATPQQMRTPNSLTRIGALAARLPGKVHDALAFTGRFAVALPKAAAAPSSVDWRSLPRLIQEFGADACQLRRPHTPPIRMVEPQLLEPQQSEDPVWLWSSAPDRYLDTALHLEVASNPNVRLVDSGRATSLAATLLVWDSRICTGDTTRRSCGVSDHGTRPSGPYTARASQ